VTRWGILLLVAFVALGLSGMETRKAVRFAVALVTVVLVGVGVKHGAL
jgi:hypothetical protein